VCSCAPLAHQSRRRTGPTRSHVLCLPPRTSGRRDTPTARGAVLKGVDWYQLALRPEPRPRPEACRRASRARGRWSPGEQDSTCRARYFRSAHTDHAKTAGARLFHRRWRATAFFPRWTTSRRFELILPHVGMDAVRALAVSALTSPSRTATRAHTGRTRWCSGSVRSTTPGTCAKSATMNAEQRPGSRTS
jgi:hypothetical protein